MRQTLFSAIVLTLFIIPVRAQKSEFTGKGTTAQQATVSKRENSNVLTEEFSFLIEDFKMNHQSEVNNLNIKIHLQYENGISESRYPDFRAIGVEGGKEQKATLRV